VPFLANTFFQAALWRYKGPGQPELYINFNNVESFEIDRSKSAVYIYYHYVGQDQTRDRNDKGARTLMGTTAQAFIADIDALWSLGN
jgi:hypothetical protein